MSRLGALYTYFYITEDALWEYTSILLPLNVVGLTGGGGAAPVHCI